MATSDPPPSRVLLGHISAAHGIRGELVIVSYTDRPEDISSYGALSDESGTRAFVIKVSRVVAKGVICRIDGIDDRNAAEALCGTKLFVDRIALPPLEADEVYHADIIGLAAYRLDGSRIGSVVAVQNFGAGDLLEIRLVNKRRTEFVPFNRTYVPELDIVGRRLVAIMPDDD
ncbi:MAG: ribosome maturation factor RimM [Hyphomicrobiaceae bacterium]